MAVSKVQVAEFQVEGSRVHSVQAPKASRDQPTVNEATTTARQHARKSRKFSTGDDASSDGAARDVAARDGAHELHGGDWERISADEDPSDPGERAGREGAADDSATENAGTARGTDAHAGKLGNAGNAGRAGNAGAARGTDAHAGKLGNAGDAGRDEPEQHVDAGRDEPEPYGSHAGRRDADASTGNAGTDDGYEPADA